MLIINRKNKTVENKTLQMWIFSLKNMQNKPKHKKSLRIIILFLKIIVFQNVELYTFFCNFHRQIRIWPLSLENKTFSVFKHHSTGSK